MRATTPSLLLLLALSSKAEEPRETFFDRLVATRTCRTGKELGLTLRDTWQTTYCRFKLKGLNLAVQGVGEPGVNLTVEELDANEFESVGFSPGQSCVAVMPRDLRNGIAVVDISSAKVFRTMNDCRRR